MFVFLLALWIVFNGRVTAETVLLGLVFAAAIFAFLCRFMDYSIEKERKLFRLLPLLVRYLCVLVVEIVKSTFGACRFIVSPTLPHDPLICKFRTPLQTEPARVLLANSITLTPGTITVSLDDGLYTVHCLDKSMAEGIERSRFVQLLLRMEEVTR
ncbi:MAG: Na+/H+ antiporter subunit E [Firmicutes bacterium]|nr:Na+/H+ antiporter subunit E [Bacillota bacterium]MBR3719216.1 Na+/H+ antiporter subunit E [Bacillota bacterium]